MILNAPPPSPPLAPSSLLSGKMCQKNLLEVSTEQPVPEDVLEGKPGDADGLDETQSLVILVGQGRG